MLVRRNSMIKKKFLLSAAAGVLSLVALASCGGGTKRTAGKLYICVYDGGYGTEWIETLAANYEAETGIAVEFSADESILDRIQNQLEKTSDYDIYMSHGINWKEYAARGWLENLDDLYTSDVKVGSSTKKFSERLIPDALKISKAKNGNEEHYYKVCYTQGTGGFIYNMDMFEENGWNVPTTYDELVTLCQTIVDAKIDAGDRTTVVPFAWAGSDRQYYWDYPVFEWWAQLAGKEKIDTILEYKGPTGKYADGYEMYNPDTYYKEFNQAYEKWYNLIALNKDYYQSGAYGAGINTARALFNAGKAAMIPYAQWGKYELIQNNDNQPLDFNIAMMKTPRVAGTTDYNYNVGFDDSIIIPNNASAESKQLAKDFLRYMARPESCKTFVEKSDGAFLAFDYKDVELGDLAKDTFINSVYKRITEMTNFNVVSQNPIAYSTAEAVMPWVKNTYYYNVACAEPTKNTPAIVGKAMYDTAKANWATWLRNAGLSD